MLGMPAISGIFGAIPDNETLDTIERARQYIRALTQHNIAPLPIAPGGKLPLDLRTAKNIADDNEAWATAYAGTDRLIHQPTAPGGWGLATNDYKRLSTYVTRYFKNSTEPMNLGLEVRRSALLVIDTDTHAEDAAFKAWAVERSGDPDWGRITPTVTTPGKQDAQGNWLHKGGGHYYFRLTDAQDTIITYDELPSVLSVAYGESKFSVYIQDAYLLIPPSVRPEGLYRMTGPDHEAGPDHWLLAFLREHVVQERDRRAARKAARERAGLSEATATALQTWYDVTPWEDLLSEIGWTRYTTDKCGCPVFSRPDGSSPKSATAHIPGCTEGRYSEDDPPIHFWTDSPGPEIAAKLSETGGKTLSKLQLYGAIKGFATDREALSELFGALPGGHTIVRLGDSPFGTLVPTLSEDDDDVLPNAPEGFGNETPAAPVTSPTPPAPVTPATPEPVTPTPCPGPGSLSGVGPSAWTAPVSSPDPQSPWAPAGPAPEGSLWGGAPASPTAVPSAPEGVEFPRFFTGLPVDGGPADTLYPGVSDTESAFPEYVEGADLDDVDLDWDEVSTSPFSQAPLIERDAVGNPITRSQSSVRDDEQTVPVFSEIADLLQRPAPEFLVKGWLPHRSLSAIIGAPNAGKSTVAVDLMCTLAKTPVGGREYNSWHHMLTKNVRVGYVCGEGLDGVLDRITAWEVAHNASVRQNMVMTQDPFWLNSEDTEWEKFMDNIEAAKLDVVVFDTLASMNVGVDENSAEAMGKVISRLQRIVHTKKVAVILVHHTARDTSHARGSTALYGALSCEMLVEKVEESELAEERRAEFEKNNVKPVRVTITKQKDAPYAKPVDMTILSAPVPVRPGQEDVIPDFGDTEPRTAAIIGDAAGMIDPELLSTSFAGAAMNRFQITDADVLDLARKLVDQVVTAAAGPDKGRALGDVTDAALRRSLMVSANPRRLRSDEFGELYRRAKRFALDRHALRVEGAALIPDVGLTTRRDRDRTREEVTARLSTPDENDQSGPFLSVVSEQAPAADADITAGAPVFGVLPTPPAEGGDVPEPDGGPEDIDGPPF